MSIAHANTDEIGAHSDGFRDDEHESWESEFSDEIIGPADQHHGTHSTDPLKALAIPIHDPEFFLTFKGITNLVIAPFFQGMFYGLGEGIARIFVGRWVGIDPLTALTGRKRDTQHISRSVRLHSQGPSFLSRWFGWMNVWPNSSESLSSSPTEALHLQNINACAEFYNPGATLQFVHHVSKNQESTRLEHTLHNINKNTKTYLN
ncbi:hypothetical protein BATDEDRAFT_86601 [Batrachochytrium dendrobatidis JAM81]|uniref:Uncharacterized protein n=2 Tax=Batrachochytrium dendrobatidis TaxID=109871 RepID=F4NXK8_BATDJ|nr:uncharacterized protein BATDEDRAFT_86601 [Batrachochytrium dendrobatidis JAM81]EGF82363.1 hypothetical protein BATDEDRAFT_86601 [Batrachochytrium dendrobatidis JAM81]KAJ8328321.1 hypothetical protein O5D80_003680 [Batrachochytrium dendrobatidis]KAK5673382.1 hypothetical protein QVD99_000830 [Batrachochytrium dendrobatidis]OAJ39841.1 hypothetical protein BDEG_23648 [Batrachochytrium dendrobatidis JEL423]|eukprot:XP_006676896.1 hypothetical protein BATDEDRAFT_86601 [Batrachochytrium dendrobatidis JAM81]